MRPNTILKLIMCVLSICIPKLFSQNHNENKIDDLSSIYLIIDQNNIDEFGIIAYELSKVDSINRASTEERKILNYAIDNLNPEIVLICLENKIGYYDVSSKTRLWLTTVVSKESTNCTRRPTKVLRDLLRKYGKTLYTEKTGIYSTHLTE